jgi:hypothetical protein
MRLRHRDTQVIWTVPEADAQVLLEQKDEDGPAWEQVETEEETGAHINRPKTKRVRAGD